MRIKENDKRICAIVKTKKRAFGFGESAEVVLIAFVAEIFFQILAVALFKNETVYSWVVIIANQCIFFATVLLFCKFKSISFLEITGAARPPKTKYFLLFIPVALFAVAAFAPLAALFTKLISKMGYTYSPDYHIDFSDPAIFTLSLLTLAILPAVGEECLIRGALLSGTKRRAPLPALLYTSLIFALFHGNAVQLVHQFLLAFVMGYLVLITRSVWASFTIHLLNNASALLLDHGYLNGWIDEKFYSYFSASFASGLSVGTFALFFALSWVALAGLLFLVTFFLKRDKETENGSPREKAQGGVYARINAFLSYMSAPTLKEKEKEQAREQATGVRLADSGTTLKGEGVLHIVLVAMLCLVVIAGVVSEVLK